MESAKPRKQRYFRYNAPLHIRQHFVRVRIEKTLRSKLGTKSRSIRVSKGDTIRVMAGAKRGTTGKVTRVNLRDSTIYIDGLVKKDARGKEYSIPVRAENVYVTDINTTDKRRAARLKIQQAARPQQQKPAAAAASTETTSIQTIKVAATAIVKE